MASFLRIQLISFLACVCLLNSAISMPFHDMEDDENENELNTEKFDDYLEDIPDEDLPSNEERDDGIINFKDDDDDAFDAEEDVEIIEPIEDEKDIEGKRDEEDKDDDEDDDDDEKDIEVKRPEEDNDKDDEEEEIEEKKFEEDNDKNDGDNEEDIEEKRAEEDDDKDDEEEAGESPDGVFTGHEPSYFKRMYEKAKHYIYGLGK